MKHRVVSSVLAVIGIVALTATLAQAGGNGGQAATLSAFFACQNINGANLDAVVNIQEFGAGTPTNANVHMGNAVLHCRQVDLTDSEGTLIDPVPGFTTDQLKCYTVNAQGTASRSKITLEDSFYRGTAAETVKVFALPSVVCAPTIPRNLD